MGGFVFEDRAKMAWHRLRAALPAGSVCAYSLPQVRADPGRPGEALDRLLCFAAAPLLCCELMF